VFLYAPISSGNQVLDKEEFGTLIKDEQVGSWRGAEFTNPTFTPWKINMEPTNHHLHPFRKAHDLRNLRDLCSI